jgi:outer membrane immunogenic protein
LPESFCYLYWNRKSQGFGVVLVSEFVSGTVAWCGFSQYGPFKEVSMKRALMIAASLALAAPQVFAQAKSFEGFSLGANAEMARSTTERAGASDSGNGSGLGLQAQYAFALGPQFVLGLGLTASTGNRNAGTLGATEFSTKDGASFDLLPGFAISESLLLYGKVSALSATNVAKTGGAETTASIDGMGVGLGLRGMVDKNLFFQVGYDENRFNDKTMGGVTVKPRSSIFSLGVGYKF